MKLQLTDRQIDILKIIANSYAPIEITVFVTKYKKSERSIRYDLKKIKTELANEQMELKYKYKQGFYLPPDQRIRCLQYINEEGLANISDFMMETEKGRMKLLFYYLFTKSQPQTADEIANHFFVSKSTILRTMKDVDRHYHDDVTLQAIKTQGFVLIGDEYKLRTMMVTCLASLFKDYFNSTDWYLQLPSELKAYLCEEDIEHIVYTIKKLNTKYNVWIVNHSFIKLLSYCLTFQLRNKFTKDTQYVNLSEEHNEKISYSCQLLQALSGNTNILQVEEEWLLMALNEYDFFIANKNQYSHQIKEITQKIITHLISLKLDLTFDFQTLYNDLHEHFNRFIHMDNSDLIYEDNCVAEEIKTRYKTYYDLAVQCAAIFEEETRLCLSETEISYIAIYIYKNVSNKTHKRKRIIVVCGTGKGVSHLVTIRINNIFPDIEVVDQMSSYQLNANNMKDIDFVVSTLPLSNCPCPVIKVSSVLSKADIYRIQNVMEYGKFIDSIPFNISNPASFIADEKLKMLPQTNQAEETNSFLKAGSTISNLILNLIDVSNALPNEYQMTHEALLGLMIHIHIAIPRWFTSQYEDDENIERLYEKMIEQHPSVYHLLENYFQVVEKTLMIILSKSEKYAFYLYIVSEEVKNEESTN